MRPHKLSGALAALIVLCSTLTGAGLAQDPEETGLLGIAGGAAAAVTGPATDIVAPTSAAPSFRLQGETVRVELDPAALEDLPGAVAPLGVVAYQATLRPSFGDEPSHQVALSGSLTPVPSQRWEGPYARDVVALEGLLATDLAPGLYDIVVPALDAEARRALSVLEAWPAQPRIVLVADTQTGDPRALQDGVHESTGVAPLSPHETRPDDLVVPPDPHPFNNATEQTLGIDLVELELEPGDRWWAYRAAIKRINAMDPAPHLVLFSGDLTFGQLVPGSYHVEYEEAWALLNGGTGLDGARYEGFHVPTLLSPGNHDAYIASGEDGFAFWEAYFGPPAFATTFANATLVSVNTYDWSELDRLGASYAVSAWGGQVRQAQLAWLRGELCQANGGTPVAEAIAVAGVGCQGGGDERIVTFSHHSPSWVQDDWPAEYGGVCQQAPCQGTPVAEQFTRGAISYTTTDQGWSGENRLALRDTLRQFHVDLHAAGHTHRDRVARDVGDGTMVEVPQKHREGLDITQLQLVTRDGEASALDQDLARTLLRQAPGPLYVETTTTASDTDQYWGYRPVLWHTGPAAMPGDALGIPPFEMGYPMTEALLEELANDPGRWNATHADLGLFSTPTFLPSP